VNAEDLKRDLGSFLTDQGWEVDGDEVVDFSLLISSILSR
jgi:hypothetical protein